ncbi:hypothetical protein [Promineifilum sp.]|uniref:hypothetical protein n=1 Tax=Promineifilum sp. TaxID=2664178 RepID=UPI0035B41FA1
MTTGAVTDATRLLPVMRRMLYASTILVISISFFLFLFPARTETLFAWTINPPLTAAVLGASYLASAPMTYLAARETVWARARVAVPGVILFTALTTLATFIHLDRFHLDAPNLFTRFVTWVWLLVYILDPIFFSYALFRQTRPPQVDPPRLAPLATWYRLALVALGAPMLLFGALMFIAPARAIPLWPWELTPLTCRAVGAWSVGIGFVILHAAWENDGARLRGAAVALCLLGLLQLFNLVRFAGTLDWGRTSAIVYTLFMAAATLVGGFGWWRASRDSRYLAAQRSA